MKIRHMQVQGTHRCVEKINMTTCFPFAPCSPWSPAAPSWPFNQNIIINCKTNHGIKTDAQIDRWKRTTLLISWQQSKLSNSFAQFKYTVVIFCRTNPESYLANSSKISIGSFYTIFAWQNETIVTFSPWLPGMPVSPNMPWKQEVSPWLLERQRHLWGGALYHHHPVRLCTPVGA